MGPCITSTSSAPPPHRRRPHRAAHVPEPTPHIFGKRPGVDEGDSDRFGFVGARSHPTGRQTGSELVNQSVRPVTSNTRFTLYVAA